MSNQFIKNAGSGITRIGVEKKTKRDIMIKKQKNHAWADGLVFLRT